MLPIPTNTFLINVPNAARGATRLLIFEKASENTSATAALNSWSPSMTGRKKLLTLSRPLCTASTTLLKKPVVLIDSFNATSQSPHVAVMPNKPPLRSVKPPNNGDRALKLATKACRRISRMANTPLKVLLRFSEAFPPSLRLAVKSFKVSVKAYNCSGLRAGNTSLKACLIGDIILKTALNVL